MKTYIWAFDKETVGYNKDSCAGIISVTEEESFKENGCCDELLEEDAEALSKLYDLFSQEMENFFVIIEDSKSYSEADIVKIMSKFENMKYDEDFQKYVAKN